MNELATRNAMILGASLLLGLAMLGWLLGSAAFRVKSLERTVVVKGLSEREVPADVAIWPVSFQEASNDLNALYQGIQARNGLVIEFLTGHGIARDAITVNPPAVVDHFARQYGMPQPVPYRYTGQSTITVYTEDIDTLRKAMADVITLGKRGVAVGSEHYGGPQYLFTGLSALKPAMIEEATKNARGVAEKFAADSNSRLGKIRSAQQGQFSIEDRDSTTQHVKKVRVVSTVEYYLSD